ncbi:protein tantalus [Rhagoletis pomonella]|uniref:protein tantalus n=1 Tax=Rhagoletis pomonella TaxID=28610 RepID=UPI00177E894C|nr:protein tantalus [Rhagoletis pomonella]
MERIVSGIAKINFQQNCEDILVENRKENMAARAYEISEAGNALNDTTKSNESTADSSDFESEFNSSSETAIVGDDDADSCCSSSAAGGSLSQRRNLPRRACKENSLKLKRRSIMKPKRHTSRSCDFSMLRPAQIKKIYCNQKLTSFHPAKLETIFEEPQAEPRRGEAAPASSTGLRFIGLRKIRRSLSCSDGLNTTKTLIKQRRAKIRKIFGKTHLHKKIALNDFIDKLNRSFADDADVEDATIDADESSTLEEAMEAEMSATALTVPVTENLHNSTMYENSTSLTKTDFEMHLETDVGNVHEFNKKNEGDSLYLGSNKFGTLSYSSDTAEIGLGAATVKANCLEGIR